MIDAGDIFLCLAAFLSGVLVTGFLLAVSPELRKRFDKELPK